jgi:DNA primase
MDTAQYYKHISDRSKLFNKIVLICKDLLHSADKAEEVRNYVDSRISSYNQNKFDFGYFPADSDLDILLSKIDKSVLLNTGLIYSNDNIFHKRSILNNHNLIIPIKDDYGNIIALVGRNSVFSKDEQNNTEEIQKYKYTYGYSKSCNLYGIYQAKKAIRNSKKVILVEGQIDCISCHGHGLHNVVALGGSSMSDYQLFLLMKHGCNKLHLLLDNDDAGKKAESKIINKYSKYISIEKVALPPEYKDIDEYLRLSNNYNALNNL